MDTFVIKKASWHFKLLMFTVKYNYYLRRQWKAGKYEPPKTICTYFWYILFSIPLLIIANIFYGLLYSLMVVFFVVVIVGIITVVAGAIFYVFKYSSISIYLFFKSLFLENEVINICVIVNESKILKEPLNILSSGCIQELTWIKLLIPTLIILYIIYEIVRATRNSFKNKNQNTLMVAEFIRAMKDKTCYFVKYEE